MNNEKIRALFGAYERAFNDLDIKNNVAFFTDTFISAGPKSMIVQNKKEFMDKAEQVRDFYKSIGQTSARAISVRQIPISDQYTMVTIHWGTTLEKTEHTFKEFDVTYIVQEITGEPRIAMLIIHQDNEEIMKKLGLT